MQEHDFLQLLADEGFGTPVVVEREPLGTLDEHAHPFEAKALVLHGSLRIRTATGERTYAVGDVFHLQRDEPHSEVFGEEGVRYRVGRKQT
ncbi:MULTISPECIES: cupin domain-containing protein [Pseudomonas]|uniref:cupin domain-containing protein n=1 Tax=Pseudomonas TaxID=286 RepID=UPI001CFB4B89|nr:MULTISPECIES: cupin [Pseudomonas]